VAFTNNRDNFSGGRDISCELGGFDLQHSQSREDAQKTFIMVCAREGLHTSDFAGPKRLEGKNVPFSFLWNMRDDPRKTIEVDVTYLPYDLEYYFSEDLAKEKPRP
jgi:hypothetical protein